MLYRPAKRVEQAAKQSGLDAWDLGTIVKNTCFANARA
jgi:hypothetical protein